MSGEWGPWIEHDGMGCPVPGDTMVSVEFRIPPRSIEFTRGNPECDRAKVWIWVNDGKRDDIIRYRIRKPRGLIILQELIEKLPEGVEA